MHRGQTGHDQSHGLNTARLAPPWRTQTLTGNHGSPGGMSFLSVFSLENGMKLTDPRNDFRVRELSHRLHTWSKLQRFSRSAAMFRVRSLTHPLGAENVIQASHPDFHPCPVVSHGELPRRRVRAPARVTQAPCWSDIHGELVNEYWWRELAGWHFRHPQCARGYKVRFFRATDL